MIAADQIEATKAFQKIECHATKTILIHKSNRDKINSGVTIAKTIGFLAWVNIYHPADGIKSIVKELAN